MTDQRAWAEPFIAVDWGTTNRRAYRIDGGRCAAEFEDGRGILAVGKDGFDAAVGEIRDRLGDLPLLLAGMVGSNRGWVEAPYVPCPAGIDDLAGALAWPNASSAIVPGVSNEDGRCDVMRGEEVQILGAVESGIIPPDCRVCHPGTHNKWVNVKGGRIASFRTVMTGELFNLLKDGSILADLLAGEAKVGEAFRDGVRTGLSGPGLSANLFEARARHLLGRLDSADGPSFVSGLLIGEDVRSGIGETGGTVVVMGRPDLTELYSEALAMNHIATERVEGEAAFIAGAKAIVERLG